MQLYELNDDLIFYINNFFNVYCHTCYKQINFLDTSFKKQNKFYFCTNDCYNFI